MPSSLWEGFVDGAYTVRSQNIEYSRCANLYIETVDDASNAKRRYLMGTPGLASQVVLADTPCRGMFSQDGRTFVVSGLTLYELTITGSGPAGTLAISATSRGTGMNNDGLPVSMASNGPGGNQLGIRSGTKLYMFNLGTNTLSAAITLPLTNNPGTLRFLNGYFLLVEVSSLKVWFSELEDGTTWNALDFFTRSNTSDDVVGMETLHDQIRVFGSKTNEVFYDNGEADNPFLPYPGSINEEGAVSQYGIWKLGDAIVWLSKNERNIVRMMMVGTGEPQVISTPAIEFALGKYTTVTDVEILCYEQEGHPFACWTFPTGDGSTRTWCWDLREQKWHERFAWNNTSCTEARWKARGFCSPGGGSEVVLVGDYVTGDVYWLDLNTFTDNTALIMRRRRAPYLSGENQWLFLEQLELGVQAGVGLASGTGVNATVNFRLSRDNGNTWTSNVPASMGTSGSYRARPIWRRLGRVRADRLVMEWSITDPVRVIWGPGCYIRASPGTGNL